MEVLVNGLVLFAKVAVPRPLDVLYDYSYREDVILGLKAGDLVKVPFGRTQVVGCIVEAGLPVPSAAESVKIKEITQKIDPEFSLPEEVFKLCKFGAEYYQYPLGEALFSAFAPSPETKKATRGLSKKAKARQELQQQNRTTRSLNREQDQALEKIKSQSLVKSDSVFLLQGVTGSGKTEVYIEAAKHALHLGKSVLILVPEIALTSQLKDRFEQALHTPIALWHSAIAEGLRQVQWLKVKSGEIRVIVGARSAIFAPLVNLGLIVVDEEHDATYKQEERFRYQARDLALYRAKLASCPVILGSATPSLESIQKVKEGKIHLLELKQRFSARPLPEVKLISLIEEAPVVHPEVKTVFALKTIRAVQAVIDRGEQVMIYLNRRGFSQFVLCKDCGWIKKCSNCSISLTHYQRKRELCCHVCGEKFEIPSRCEQCQSHELKGMGSGTETLEEELKILINGAKVLRLDREMITSQGRLEQTLDDFRDLKANILIGTQMLVKGHDFPKVTCVVIVSADMLLKWPDFRASERALQTLTQVAGRSGRGEILGEVLIQGYDLGHPVIQILTGELDQAQFIEGELALRRELHYPPFSRFVRYRAQHEQLEHLKQKVERMAQALRHELSDEQQARLLGPSEALLQRVKNQYRYDLYFKAKNVTELFTVSARVKKMAQIEDLQLTVDVDPYSA